MAKLLFQATVRMECEVCCDTKLLFPTKTMANRKCDAKMASRVGEWPIKSMRGRHFATISQGETTVAVYSLEGRWRSNESELDVQIPSAEQSATAPKRPRIRKDQRFKEV